MIFGVYSIRDNKTGFMSITISKNDQTAMRDFAYAVNQKNSVMNFKPEDFELFCLGAYDQENGILLPEEAEHRLVITGINCIEREK